MGLFTLTINAKTNQPPEQIGNLNLSLDYNELYVFTSADFTTNTIPTYQDPEGDDYEKIQILSLPTVGSLELNSVPVSINDEITKIQIDNNLLTYQCDAGDTDGYIDSDMTFDIADEGSSTFSGLTPGIVTFTVANQINLPPSAVGDNSLVTNYGQTIVFTSADFTTGTTPAYSDPEGDPAYSLKVLTLPTNGTLKLNGINVVLNQEILFADIGLGLFTFVPDNSITTLTNVDFNFSIKDSVSGQYTE